MKPTTLTLLATAVLLVPAAAHAGAPPAAPPLRETVVISDGSPVARHLAADLRATRRREAVDHTSALRAEAHIVADRARLALLDQQIAAQSQAMARAVHAGHASVAGDAGMRRMALIERRDRVRAELARAEVHRQAALVDHRHAARRVARLDRQADRLAVRDLSRDLGLFDLVL